MMHDSFIRNSIDAVERLHHARNRTLMPSRVVNRNTRLIYVDQSLVLLQFHDTPIARFTEDGCVLNTNGWYTNSTWDRIDSHTPARTHRANGLRYVATGWGWDTLYTPDLQITPEGETVNPMARPLVAHISTAVRSWTRTVSRYARKCAETWDTFGESDPCDNCVRYTEATSMFLTHFAKHIAANEVVLCPPVTRTIQAAANAHLHLHGDDLVTLVAQSLTKFFRNEMTPPATEIGAQMGLQYPQSHTRRYSL